MLTFSLALTVSSFARTKEYDFAAWAHVLQLRPEILEATKSYT